MPHAGVHAVIAGNRHVADGGAGAITDKYHRGAVGGRARFTAAAGNRYVFNRHIFGFDVEPAGNLLAADDRISFGNLDFPRQAAAVGR